MNVDLSKLPPQDILDAARKVEYWFKEQGIDYWKLGDWFKEQGIDYWKLGGVCSRKYALLLDDLEQLIKTNGELTVNHSQSGSGLGLHWGACLGDKWPYCHGSHMVYALEDVVKTYNCIRREQLQKELNAIDLSAQL